MLMPYRILKWVKVHIDAAFGPMMHKLYGMGVRPLHFTILSLPTGLYGVWCMFNGPMMGTLAIGAYLILDIADGTMARTTNTVTKKGAILDFTFDTIIACSFLIGLYIHGIEPHFAAFSLVLLLAAGMEELGLIRR